MSCYLHTSKNMDMYPGITCHTCVFLLFIHRDILFFVVFFKVFVGPRSILRGQWYPLFQTSDYSAHEFQSQGGPVITCALLSLACNGPQSHLWLPALGIEPGSLTPEALLSCHLATPRGSCGQPCLIMIIRDKNPGQSNVLTFTVQ